jgi:selenophosphate synthase
MNFKHNATPYQWSKSHQVRISAHHDIHHLQVVKDHSIIVKLNLISSILEKNGQDGRLLDENAIMWGAGSLFAGKLAHGTIGFQK